MALPVNIDALAQHEPCEFAKHRYNGIARWRFLWTLLVFVLGVLVAVMLAVAIVTAIDEEWGVAIATAVGTIVTGSAMTFVLNQRKEAKDEEEAAYDDVVTRCGAPTQPQVETFRGQLKVFGIR